ncbi:UDP-glucose/GDP-mannose dehydrogenase family protein [Cryobacterium sp. BB307]|uniref:UDP-glucose dehydrogenase family protein n=1 Tax=Cryobacterium sp. BB307 TaxID=2716317 RepID=UPI001444ADB0|nr:UDP-glucose/GDP-mannose dehydrogenase family protein [Cryobacterium sp. BB307]
MRISVIGCGYLGAVHATCMAQLGHDVVGIDVDAAKVAALAAARPPFFEPGLAELLESTLATGRLRFSTDIADAADAEVHFIAVGTPQLAGSDAADLSYVRAAIYSLVPVLAPGALVVGKSTVPVGTAAMLSHVIQPTGARLAWNPEFLREGFAISDTVSPDRIVYGVAPGDALAEAQLDEVYAGALAAGTPKVVTDYATAELVKVSANAFLATKISFINAMAEIAEATGADVTQLADAIGHDARIGRRFLNAGLGFGGGCLPKDIRAFMARAEELEVDQALTFLRSVDAINLRRRDRMVDLAREAVGGSLAGKRAAVLGLAFKPNSDDVRDSPALDVAARLVAAGASVRATDPKAIETARLRHPELHYVEDWTDAVRGADVVLVLTEWDDYRRLDPDAVGSVVTRRAIVDGRNCLDPVQWREAGWHYRALGRPPAVGAEHPRAVQPEAERGAEREADHVRGDVVRQQ